MTKFSEIFLLCAPLAQYFIFTEQSIMFKMKSIPKKNLYEHPPGMFPPDELLFLKVQYQSNNGQILWKIIWKLLGPVFWDQ